jgi:hypothetical protein
MDSVWLQEESPGAANQQDWFIALGHGVSVRKLDLPLCFTRRMAHCFLSAPEGLSVEAALLWAQVAGLGGDRRLFRSILGSRIASDFANNEFWLTVVVWLIKRPFFDQAQVGPLVDFIHRRKFEPAAGDPVEPEFSVQGRTADSLLRQMGQWHKELARHAERSEATWTPSGIGTFHLCEGVEGSNSFRRWTIIEIVSRTELAHEGRAMGHCVASYESSCRSGASSIWSLGVEGNTGRRRRVLTIEVLHRTKSICQIRGRANRLARSGELLFIQRWAAQEGLIIPGIL